MLKNKLESLTGRYYKSIKKHYAKNQNIGKWCKIGRAHV